MNKSKNIQKQLEENFEELLSFGSFSKEQKKELFTKLEGAIAANIVVRLLDRLSSDDQKLLNDGEEFKDVQELFRFFSDKLSKEEFLSAAEESIKEVIEKFLSKF